ncbi:hypothetical protein ACHAWF_009460 [Thalassiosira exigua]
MAARVADAPSASSSEDGAGSLFDEDGGRGGGGGGSAEFGASYGSFGAASQSSGASRSRTSSSREAPPRSSRGDSYQRRDSHHDSYASSSTSVTSSLEMRGEGDGGDGYDDQGSRGGGSRGGGSRGGGELSTCSGYGEDFSLPSSFASDRSGVTQSYDRGLDRGPAHASGSVGGSVRSSRGGGRAPPHEGSSRTHLRMDSGSVAGSVMSGSSRASESVADSRASAGRELVQRRMSPNNDDVGEEEEEEEMSRAMVESHGGSSRGDEGTIEVYDRGGRPGRADAAEPPSREDRLALRMTKETRAHEHLLRLLREMEGGEGGDGGSGVGGGGGGDPSVRARASLIGDFEREVATIRGRVREEDRIAAGEGGANPPPLPPGWIELEDPDSGDAYYANEDTGEDGDFSSNETAVWFFRRGSFRWVPRGVDATCDESEPGVAVRVGMEVVFVAIGWDSLKKHHVSASAGMTQWERPGMITELEERLDRLHSSSQDNNFDSGNFNASRSNMSNAFESSQRSGADADDFGDGQSRASNTLNNSQRSNDFDGSRSNMGITFQSRSNRNGHEGSQSNISGDFEGSQSNMSNTYESSLTDTNDGQGLPSNWMTLEDPDSGDTYYANEETGETTWERPTLTLPKTMTVEVDNDSEVDKGDQLPPGWIALEDADSGDTYYLNEKTMETTWDRPCRDNSEKGGPEIDDNSEDEPDNDNGDGNNDEEEEDASNEDNDTVGDSDDLPPGWEAILDPSSGDYYYVQENGETQWERPRPMSTPQPEGEADNDAPSQQGPLGDDEGDGLQGDLPPGWFATVDEDSGDQYYCNANTGETTWDFPSEQAGAAAEEGLAGDPNDVPGDQDDDDLPSGWFSVNDPSSGDVYYVHEESGETTWDRPNGSTVEQDDQLMKRLTLNDDIVYEDGSVTSSQY